MIEGSGSLISDVDEEGLDLPFMTTDQILRELQRFGFIIFYDVKKNLPSPILSFLSTVNDLGYDKITRVALQTKTASNGVIWAPTILVIKSEFNLDLLEFDCKLTRKDFNQKLSDNVIMNVTHEEGMKWDWVNYTANIDDLLDENTTEFDDQFKPIHEHHPVPPFPLFFGPEYSDDNNLSDDDQSGCDVGENNISDYVENP